jgi:hypothetical protein
VPGDRVDGFGVPADSWRTSSLTSVSPKATTRRSTSASRPSAITSLPTARSEVSQSRSVSASSPSVSSAGVSISGRGASVSSASAMRIDDSNPPLQIAQHGTIRFVRPGGARAQLCRGAGHRELEAEHLDFARVERQRRPPRHQRRTPGDVRCDRRIAVAIAADPRAEPDRCGSGGSRCWTTLRSVRSSDRQSSGTAFQIVSSNTAMPDRTSSSGDGRSRLTSRCARSRRSRGASTRAPPRFRTASGPAIPLGQRRGNAVVFVLQRAPHDLGRVAVITSSTRIRNGLE